MNTLITRKIVFGMLMVLVLAFSVQSIADALTLTPRSDKVQSKLANSMFEIQFSIGLKSDTTAIRNDQGKLMDDGTVGGTEAFAASAAVRIDSQGYLVTVIDGKDYRNTKSGTNGRLVPPTPPTPDPPNDAPDGRIYAPYTVNEKISGSTYAPTAYTGEIYADSSKLAYSSRGFALHYYTPAFTYDHDSNSDTPVRTAAAKASSQIKIRTEDFAEPRPTPNRYHYNDEAITISVTVPTNATMNVRLQSGSVSYPVNLLGDLTRATIPITNAKASLWEGGGARSLPSSITLICEPSLVGTYIVTIKDVSPTADFPNNAPETLEQAKIDFTIFVEEDAAPTATLDFSKATGSLLRLDTERSIVPIHTHFNLSNTGEGTPVGTLPANTSIRYKVTTGSGLLYVGAPDRE